LSQFGCINKSDLTTNFKFKLQLYPSSIAISAYFRLVGESFKTVTGGTAGFYLVGFCAANFIILSSTEQFISESIQ
jgi:hypothetical protein